MGMEDHKLKVFCTVAETRSFLKTSEIIHLTQPTVSLQIQALEEMYETKLFDRSSSGVTLTPGGEVLYKYAKEILAIYSAAEKVIAEMTGLVKGSITIGVGEHARAAGRIDAGDGENVGDADSARHFPTPALPGSGSKGLSHPCAHRRDRTPMSRPGRYSDSPFTSTRLAMWKTRTPRASLTVHIPAPTIPGTPGKKSASRAQA